MKLWLTEWEWQCCGDYFEVDSQVEWDLMPFQQKEWAHLDALGEDLLGTITHYAAPDDHIADEERLRAVRTRGRVESVSAVYFTWARTHRWRRRSDQPALGSSVLTIGTWLGPRHYRPVIGGAVLEARDRLDFKQASDPNLGGLQRFIVELSPVDLRA